MNISSWAQSLDLLVLHSFKLVAIFRARLSRFFVVSRSLTALPLGWPF